MPWPRGTARSRWSMAAWPRRRGSSGRQSGDNPQRIVARKESARPPRDAEWGERFFHVTDPDGHELSFAWPQTGSMTAAGALIGVTQPAISRLIRDLEGEIGWSLFDRS